MNREFEFWRIEKEKWEKYNGIRKEMELMQFEKLKKIIEFEKMELKNENLKLKLKLENIQKIIFE